MKTAIINYNIRNDKVSLSEFERLTNLCQNCLKENPDILAILNEHYELIEVNFYFDVNDKSAVDKINCPPTPAICQSRNKNGRILVFLKHFEEVTANRKDIQDVQAYQKNGLFEEFCHLAEQKGDCSFHPKALELWYLYKSKGLNWQKFGHEIIKELNADREHYKVFSMMLNAYPDDWVKRYFLYFSQYTPEQYDAQYFELKKNFPFSVTQTRLAASLVKSYLRMLNVLFVAEKAKDKKISCDNKKLLETLLETGKTNIEGKRNLIEKELGTIALSHIDSINEKVFETSDSFFSAILKLWINLNLIPNNVEVPFSGSKWTENHPVGTWTWAPGFSGTLDEYSTGHPVVGTKSIYCHSNTGGTNVICDIEKAWGTPFDASVIPGYSYGRFSALEIVAYIPIMTSNGTLFGQLTDSSGNVIQNPSKIGDLIFVDYGKNVTVTFGNLNSAISSAPDGKHWSQVSGSGFDWSAITKLELDIDVDEIYYDALHWVGGLPIDPVMYPTLNPMVATDAIYGKTYHHIDETGITSFETAQATGKYLAQIMGKPIIKVFATNSAYTWVKPQQYLHLYQPDNNIGYTEKWRILEVSHNWDKSKGNKIRTSFSLIKRPDQYKASSIQMDTLAGILKAIGKT